MMKNKLFIIYSGCLSFILLLPTLVLAQSTECIGDGSRSQDKVSGVDYNQARTKLCVDINCCAGLSCVVEAQETGRDKGILYEWYGYCKKVTDQTGTIKVEEKPEEVKFVPQVTVPGSISIGGTSYSFTKDKPITINGDTLGIYLAIFYRFFVGAIAVMAVVMVMWGGFKRLYAAGSQEKIKNANDTIVSAISGLVIALLAYTLLNLVNPKLVEFKTLEIMTISKNTLEWSAEPQLVAQKKPTLVDIAPSENRAIADGIDTSINQSALTAINEVLIALNAKGYGMYITSVYRSPEKQKQLIAENCKNPPGSERCDPKPNKPPTCVMANGPYSCPHTTGNAIDIWATKDYKICIESILPAGDKLSGFCGHSGKTKCLQDECQAFLISEMKKAGFCNLCSEPWHFEYVKGDFKGSPGCTC